LIPFPSLPAKQLYVKDEDGNFIPFDLTRAAEPSTVGVTRRSQASDVCISNPPLDTSGDRCADSNVVHHHSSKRRRYGEEATASQHDENYADVVANTAEL
jgi:hypothetical protein